MNFKKIPICLLIIFIVNIAFADGPAYIISGFDDVLRQSDNTSLLQLALRLSRKDLTFAGMPELFEVMTESESTPKFLIISATSHWLENRIEGFLKQSGFPAGQLQLRNWITEWSILDFKMTRIRQALNEKPDRKFIVILDNSEASLRFAGEIRSEFPERLLAIYLRNVSRDPIPPDTVGFFTAFDIALQEYQKGRLKKDLVEKVGQAILKEANPELIIPGYATCPPATNPRGGTHGPLQEIDESVQRHLQKLCRH